MARSARRKSLPSSPAKHKKPASAVHQLQNIPEQDQAAVVAEELPERRTRRTQTLELKPDRNDAPTKRSRKARQASSPKQPGINSDGNPPSPEIMIQLQPASSTTSYSTLDSEVQGSVAPQLDVDSIISCLPHIDAGANSILKIFARTSHEQLVQSLEDPGSLISRSLRSHAKLLASSLQECGPYYMVGLDEMNVIFEGANRPYIGAQYIFIKANLASFILGLVGIDASAHPSSPFQHLHRLLGQEPFPQPFIHMPCHPVDQKALADATFQSATQSIGVSIMTQMYIHTASNSKTKGDSDLEALLRQIFVDDDGELRNLSASAPASRQGRRMTETVERRMQNLSKSILSENLDALRRKYPWAAFLDKVIDWTKQRSDQVNRSIAALGGIDSIETLSTQATGNLTEDIYAIAGTDFEAEEDLAMAKAAAFFRNFDNELDAQIEQSRSGALDDKGKHNRQALHEDQLRSERVATRKEKQQSTIPESPRGDSDTHLSPLKDKADQQLEENHDFAIEEEEQSVERPNPRSSSPPLPTQPTEATLRVLSVARRQEQESNKENKPPSSRLRLTDRQPNATRVTFEEDEAPESSANGKRPRPAVELSESDDEAFEADARQPKRQRKNGKSGRVSRTSTEQRHNERRSPTIENQTVPSTMHASDPRSRGRSIIHRPKKPGNTDSRAGPSSNQNERSLGRPSTQADERRDHAGMEANPPPASYEEYAQTKQRAVSNGRLAALTAAPSSEIAGAKRPQVRRAWNEEEIRRLIGLMQKYGCMWSKIKQVDNAMREPILANRSQVQCKDKARVMKLDFLRAEVELPEYLWDVTIKTKDVEDLRSRGIAIPDEYLRSEV